MFRMTWKTSMIARRKYPEHTEHGVPKYVREFLTGEGPAPTQKPELLPPMGFKPQQLRKGETMEEAEARAVEACEKLAEEQLQ